MNTYRIINIGGGGAGSDDKKVKISSDDTTPDFIEGKIESGDSIVVVSTTDPGADETLTITVDETAIDHDNLLNYAADEHTPLNDAATTSSNVWSASKIQAELDAQDDASEITYTPNDATDWDVTPSEVDAALDELAQRVNDDEDGLADHLADATDAHDASAISSVAAGNLAATDVQSALDELQSDVDTRALDSDLTAHINDSVDAHDASAISFDNVASGLTATEAQSAIDELAAEKYDAADFDGDYDTRLATKDTDDLAEGATNLYHTVARARAAAVVDSMAGSETDQAPSVSSIKAYVGINDEDILQQKANFSNNVVTPGNVAGLVFDPLTVVSFVATLAITRSADALYEEVQIRGIYDGSTYLISTDSVGDPSGLTFSITSAGQVQYTSSNLTGGGQIYYVAKTITSDSPFFFSPDSVESMVQWLFRGDGTTYSTARPHELEDNSAVPGATYHSGVPREGACCLFDGVNDRVIGTGNEWTPSSNNPVSYSCWINFQGVSSGSNAGIFGGFNGGIGNSIGMVVRTSGTTAVNFIVRSSAGRVEVGYSTALTIGTWYHVVVTYDGGMDASTVGFYINGSSVTSSTSRDDLATTFTTNTIQAGGTGTGSADSNNMKLADAQVYDYELTSSQASRLYANSYDYDTAPRTWWKLNEESGPSCYDSAENETATATNVTLSTFRAIDNLLPVNSANDVGWSGARYFDGTSCVVTNHHDDINFGDGSTDSAFSMEYYVRCTDPTASLNGIMGKATSFDTGEYYSMIHSSDLFFRTVDESTNGYRGISVPFTSTDWVHVVCTYDGAGTGISDYNIYLNGNLGSPTDISLGSYTAMEDTGSGVRLGCRTDGSNFLTGAIRQGRIYNYELSAAQVARLAADNTDYDTAPVEQWDLNRSGEIEVGSILGIQGRVDGATPLIIPRNESITTEDTMGLPLDFAGKVKHTSKLNTPMVTFGTGAWIESTTGIFDYGKDDTFTFVQAFRANNGSSGAGRRMVAKEDSSYYGYSASMSSGVVRIILRVAANTNEILVITDNTYNDGLDHVLTFSYDGSSDASGVVIYIDGVAVSTTTSYNNLSSDWKKSSETFKIGGHDDGTLSFEGSLGTTQGYNYVMTPAQVAANYLDFSAYPTAPDEWFPLQEGYGANVYGVISGTAGAFNGFTLSSAWANTQQRSHYALKNGYVGVIEQPSSGGPYSEVTLDSSISLLATDNFMFSCNFEIGDTQTIGLWGGSANGFAILRNTDWRVDVGGATVTYTFSDWGYNDYTEGYIEFERDGADFTIRLYDKEGGTLLNSETEAFTESGAWDWDAIGSRSGSTQPWLGKINNFKFFKNGTLINHWELYHNAIDKVSGNNGTLDGEYGFVNIPVDSSDTSPVTAFEGTEILAGKYHNGCQTTIEQYSSPQMRTADDLTDEVWFTEATGAPKQVAFADIPTVSTDDQIFSDQSTDNQAKEIMTFDETLTGDELSGIKGHTNNN